MKTHNEKMKVKQLVLALRFALVASIAIPTLTYADDDLDALIHPTNTIDFGTLYSTQSSAKFGQYNGINTEGAYGIGGFDIRGGKGYDPDKNSALRWKLGGANLGTTSRSLDGSVSDQGKWKLNLGYDELQHNITDTYQTPLIGSPGGNNFTLPQNFGPIGAKNPFPSSAIQVANTNSLSSNQLGDFHTEQEHVNRKNGSISTSYTFSDQLSAQVDYNHLDQYGAKLIGTGSQGGINVGNGIGSLGVTGKGEAINILMNPTNYQTDNITTTLNWTGDKGHLSGGYYGSMFHDDYNSLSWQSAVVNPGTGPTNSASLNSRCAGTNCYTNNTMSTAPSNSLHQANLTGGYNFTSTTKLAGGFSYGYNQQNSNYASTLIPQASGTAFNMMQANGLPASSLNGLVLTTHGDLKLTNQSIKDLTLTTGFKFNERENRTNSNIYKYLEIAGSGYTGYSTPYSNRKTQFEAGASYHLTKAQNIALNYDHEIINRWCNGVVGGAQCVASPTSDEDKVGLTYRLKALDTVNFNAGYTYANRQATNDPNFRANAGNYDPTLGAVSHSALNAGNFLGYIAYPYANRNENMGKAGINWQVTQKLDVGLNGHLSYDQYNPTLGVQNGQSTGVNVEATYNLNENSTLSAYWNWQNGQRNLRSGQNGSQTTAPTNIWTNKLDDNGHVVGMLARHGGMLNGNLELIADTSYSYDTSTYSSQVFYNPTSTTTCGSLSQLSCGTLSPIKNELISLKLTSNYKVLKNGKISLSYLYQKLNSNDYFYYGQQFGTVPTSLMPTGLQMQNYGVNVVALSYSYAF